MKQKARHLHVVALLTTYYLLLATYYLLLTTYYLLHEQGGCRVVARGLMSEVGAVGGGGAVWCLQFSWEEFDRRPMHRGPLPEAQGMLH